MKIAIIDLLGLTYDGNTLQSRGLGGSESAVILISQELRKIGFEVTVFNNCKDSRAKPGIYDQVNYVDHSESDPEEFFDIVISSRSVFPFFEDSKYSKMCARASYKVVWMHDTFCEGDQHIEDMLNKGIIDELFTLSDFHTNYILNCEHGQKRNYEVLKNKIFQTRNGAVKWFEDEYRLANKDKNQFVYNASVTKGLKPLLNHIWPKVKEKIPEAKLTVIGGYYRFREGAEPDAQEKDLQKFREEIDPKLDVTFTGVISQYKIGEILSKAGFMIYPTDFPETFGISTLEALLYKTPVITCNFGALESTALDLACYKIDYASVPNGLFPHINEEQQSDLFVDLVLKAYNDDYLTDQKRTYCEVVEDIHGWDTVALQWKQQIYFRMEKYLPVNDFRKVRYINDKVNRVYGKTFTNEVERQNYEKTCPEKRILIISPFRNAENYIQTHCESIDQQDYDNYLHIVINDNSDDDSKNRIPPSPKRIVINNEVRKGCISNQLHAVKDHVREGDIVMLLDGDDFLVSNNTIFNYYNFLYEQGYHFTYGSCWSLADGIPLIAQTYPEKVRKDKSFRRYLFNWKIPYTHLRTCLGATFALLDWERYKDENGEFMMSGMDNPLFYELIENTPSERIKAVKEIVCYYNDINPLNDYKIHGEEQNINANKSYEQKYLKEEQVKPEDKTILIAIPTNAGIEPETFKSIYNMRVPDGYNLKFEYFYGYQIDQIRNLIAEWAKHYDYLFSIDSDIVVPEDALEKMLAHDKDAVSGVYIQRLHDRQTVELYYDEAGGQANYTNENLPKDQLISVSAFGFGCVLIKGEVFRSIEYPHFVYYSALDHKDTVSEDVDFCMKAKDKGFELYADTSIICDHIGKHTFKLGSPTVVPPTIEEEAPEHIVYDLVGNSLYKVDNGVANILIENVEEGLDLLLPKDPLPYPDLLRIDSVGNEIHFIKTGTMVLENTQEVIIRIRNDEPNSGLIRQYLIDLNFESGGIIDQSEEDKDYKFFRAKSI